MLETHAKSTSKTVRSIDRAVIRFAGDSGDGMQLVGDQFTNTSALAGNMFATLPDFPSEIRAPSGTVFGVSGFQICISPDEVYTPGDLFDVLLAMNPAALKVNLGQVKKGGTILVNDNSFEPKNLEKAGYKSSPFEDPQLKNYKVMRVPLTQLTQKALAGKGLSSKEVDRCKNFFALGILYWLFDRNPAYTKNWIAGKFKNKPLMIDANQCVLEAGMAYAAESPDFVESYKLRKPSGDQAPGVYRHITGNQASAMGLLAAAQKANLKLFLGSYPITPATDILHELCLHREQCTILQAEDEIAAIGATIGAAFGGALAATSTSGPGLSLKSEFLNLAVMTELPIVVINVQRGGPSTGLPTKTEQADSMQALWGRHGESPVIILAASSPKDCFDTVFEASRLALKYMTPTIVLTEGYLGNGAEVWKVPDLSELPKLSTTQTQTVEGYRPYNRNPETLARPWAVPGTPGMQHRLGGLEKEDGTGLVSQNPQNHEKMVHIRAEKVARVAREIPKTEIFGHPQADLLVLAWGGPVGAVKEAVRSLSSKGAKVAGAQVKYLNPLPPDLGPLLKKYKKVLVPELNTGHLWGRLRSEYLIDTIPFNKIQGQPFRIDEIEAKITSILGA